MAAGSCILFDAVEVPLQFHDVVDHDVKIALPLDVQLSSLLG